MDRRKQAWLSFCCNLDSDKFRHIEAEFGLSGFAVIVKLHQRIFDTGGYYTEWDTNMAMAFAQEIGIKLGLLNEIVNATLNRGIFDRALWRKNRVLSSWEIREWFFADVHSLATNKVENGNPLDKRTQNSEKANGKPQILSGDTQKNGISHQEAAEKGANPKLDINIYALSKNTDLEVKSNNLNALSNQTKLEVISPKDMLNKNKSLISPTPKYKKGSPPQTAIEGNERNGLADSQPVPPVQAPSLYKENAEDIVDKAGAKSKPKPVKLTDEQARQMFQAYTDNTEVQELLWGWYEGRKASRANNTETAIKYALGKIGRMVDESVLPKGEGEPAIVLYLKEVVARGWQSFYKVDYQKGYMGKDEPPGKKQGSNSNHGNDDEMMKLLELQASKIKKG